MAVYEPRARIICFESQDSIAALAQKCYIATRRVVEFQVHDAVPVGRAGLPEDGEVVAVEVDLEFVSLIWLLNTITICEERENLRDEKRG
jgi:hypothetical protein